MTGIATVPGVCDGGLVGNTPNHLTVKIPTLTVADDPGFRVKLTDDFVSSMNVLDSSYIVRKQITNSSFHSSQVVF